MECAEDNAAGVARWRPTAGLTMSQAIERIWPYAAAIAVLAFWWIVLQAPFPPNPDGLLAASGGASAVLVGFLATAKTVILAITGARVFQKLKAGGFTKLIFAYLYEAIFAGVAFLVVSVIGFFIEDHAGNRLLFSAVWVFMGAVALMLYVRITHLLFKMLDWVTHA